MPGSDLDGTQIGADRSKVGIGHRLLELPTGRRVPLLQCRRACQDVSAGPDGGRDLGINLDGILQNLFTLDAAFAEEVDGAGGGAHALIGKGVDDDGLALLDCRNGWEVGRNPAPNHGSGSRADMCGRWSLGGCGPHSQ